MSGSPDKQPITFQDGNDTYNISSDSQVGAYGPNAVGSITVTTSPNSSAQSAQSTQRTTGGTYGAIGPGSTGIVYGSKSSYSGTLNGKYIKITGIPKLEEEIDDGYESLFCGQISIVYSTVYYVDGPATKIDSLTQELLKTGRLEKTYAEIIAEGKKAKGE